MGFVNLRKSWELFMPSLFLLFSHKLTAAQMQDARQALQAAEFIALPEALQARWSNIPPEIAAIQEHLRPVFDWLGAQSQAGDYVLAQGDFGAVFLTVEFARMHGLIPVYSTTRRQVVETTLPDGTVQAQHTFQHVRYREYPQASP